MDPASSPRLAALDFTETIDALTRDFTGREWLLREVADWLARGREQCLILTGEPGIGKSAFAARLMQTRTDVCAHHFCVAGRGDTIVPHTILRSVAAQLGRQLPGYGAALAGTVDPIHLSVRVNIDVRTMSGGQITGVVIEQLTLADPEREFEVLLRAPLAALERPPRPLVMIVDSLDEAATYRGQPTFVELLAKFASLPDWLRVFCTTRDDRRVLRHFDAVPQVRLAAGSPMNRDDIDRYVHTRSRTEPVRSWLGRARMTPDELFRKLSTIPLENFLHGRLVLDDLVAGRHSTDDLKALPAGIDAAYHQFLARFGSTEWETRVQPVFGVLAVAGEALTAAQLSRFTGIPRTTLHQTLGVARQFLTVTTGDTRFTLFHDTLREYLTDEYRNHDFWCAPEDGHRAVAEHYLRAVGSDPPALDDYAVRHLADHLIELRNWAGLTALLENADFWERTGRNLGSRTIYGGGAQIEKFLHRCLEALPESFRTASPKLRNISGPEQQFMRRRSNEQQCNASSFSSCLNYCSVDAGQPARTTSSCHLCGGTVRHGLLDIGGPDYFEHAYSWCTGCFWSAFGYYHSDDITHEPLRFDTRTNLWTTRAS